MLYYSQSQCTGKIQKGEMIMYSIEDLAEMTGLTSRTLRSYLSAGFLHGEKVEGKWQFTPEQFGDFLVHPAVKPALKAKRNSAVFDFLADSQKPADEACVILDVTDGDLDAVMDFFCGAVTARTGMHMSYQQEKHRARVILTGSENQVLEVLGEYREMRKKN